LSSNATKLRIIFGKQKIPNDWQLDAHAWEAWYEWVHLTSLIGLSVAATSVVEPPPLNLLQYERLNLG
jgi:hypothetical protein